MSFISDMKEILNGSRKVRKAREEGWRQFKAARLEQENRCMAGEITMTELIQWTNTALSEFGVK